MTPAQQQHTASEMQKTAPSSKAIYQMLESIAIDATKIPLLTDSEFVFKAPTTFIEQIKTSIAGNENWRNKPQDNPLLKQILPVADELTAAEGFSTDPVADLEFNPHPSLIHKYHGRALMIASPKCDIHCRYCFRRHFPYEDQVNQRHWQQALDSVAKDTSIHELILSGGDPMSLSESALMKLIAMVEKIEHIRTLRIHSRTPIAAPDKAAQHGFLDWVQTTRLKVVLVVHCNHADELSEHSAKLLANYRAAGITLLNQSVLLKGVNDSVEVLEQLSHKLFEQGVLPYYLNQLDRVAGSAHFEVNDKQAITLHNQLRGRLPGYLMPKLVKDIIGKSSKTQLS